MIAAILAKKSALGRRVLVDLLAPALEPSANYLTQVGPGTVLDLAVSRMMAMSGVSRTAVNEEEQ